MDYEIWFEAMQLANEVVDSNYPLDERAIPGIPNRIPGNGARACAGFVVLHWK
jgi:hypothetical protein